MTTIQSWNKFIAPTYAPPEIKIVSGKGTRVYDELGKSYLDFISGIAVTSLGHANEEIAEAIYKQAKSLGHVSNMYANPVTEELADRLLEISGMRNGRVFFTNSGAEANEAAIKYVRAFKPKSKLLALEGSFHGRTMGALSLTGQTEKRRPFEPLIPKVEFLKANSVSSAKRKLKNGVGGIWLELIQGEGGVNPLSEKFLSEVIERANKKSIALVVDEVQTGMGRTGYWFAFQELNLEPNLVPIAKGLGGGMPIGALLISEEFANLIKPGGHGTTYGGNPIAARSALTVIKLIEENSILDNVMNQSLFIRNTLSTIPGVNCVRGKGLLLGIVFNREISKRVASLAMELGLLVNAVRPDVVRLAPPLNISTSEAEEGIEILTKSIVQAQNESN